MKRTKFKTIKELPLEFDKNKFHFKQVYNRNEWYAYELTDEYGNKWYEVFKEQAVNNFTYDKENGKFITSKEDGHIAYPSNESFGRWAWTTPTMESIQRTIDRKSTWMLNEENESEITEEEESYVI
jgi:hypothetical protein